MSLIVVYNLRPEELWDRARRDRRYWEVLYTGISTLGNDHVALTFHPAPNPRWRPWEEVRRRWVLEGAA